MLQVTLDGPDAQVNIVAVHSNPADPTPARKAALSEAFVTADRSRFISVVLGGVNEVFPGDVRLNLDNEQSDLQDDNIGKFIRDSAPNFSAIGCDGFAPCDHLAGQARRLSAIDHILIGLDPLAGVDLKPLGHVLGKPASLAQPSDHVPVVARLSTSPGEAPWFAAVDLQLP